MEKFTIKLSAFALAGFAALNSAALPAEDERWFRVELLVFANHSTTATLGAELAEQWDATPALAYPSASRFLVDPARVAGNAAEFEGGSLLDEYGRQIITILMEPEGADAAASAGYSPLAKASDTDEATPVTEQPVPVPKPLTPVYSEPLANEQLAKTPMEMPMEGPMESPPALPRPFVILPGDYRELRGKAALMERDGRYSILFHESWVQPVGPETSSLPIVLDRSGDEQQWPPLQGSIKVFLARYLLLETNLWLNTAGDYLPGTWQMPPPPFGPPSLVIEEVETVDLATEIEQMADGAADTIPRDPDFPADVMPPDPNSPADAMPRDPNSPLGDGLEAEEAPGPVYPYRHAVLLDQKRRMRSNEVHYIDHPLLGLIIKFTPVTAQELAEIARSQAEILVEETPTGQGQSL